MIFVTTSVIVDVVLMGDFAEGGWDGLDVKNVLAAGVEVLEEGV